MSCPAYTYATNEANERAHSLALTGNLLPRDEWKALDIPGNRAGKRMAHLNNAIRARLGSPHLIHIPLEWITEYNELNDLLATEND